MPDKGKLGDHARLLHIFDAIHEIKTYLEEVNFEKFAFNSLVKNACIRQLEIIGEACTRLSDQLKNEYPEVSWREIIALRNLLIHQYFGVDDKIVWQIIESDLPDFEEKIKAILKKYNTG